MKKLLLSLIVAITATFSTSAQNWFSEDVFNHLSVGVNGGSPGIGVDLATTVGSHFQLRAGVAIMPNIKFSTTIWGKLTDDYYDPWNSGYYYGNDVNIDAKRGFTNGKLLLDFYPSRNKSIHLTVGAYFGASKVVEVYNEEYGAFHNFKDLHIGDYILTPDENGNINAQFKTNSFKPYVGIGFGRSVAKRKRLSFQMDMGVMFWGKPKLICNDQQIEATDIEDEGEFLDVVSNLRVYPVLNFRLSGKIF